MEIKRWLIPLTAFVVLWKSWHKVEDTSYLPVGAKAYKGSLIMKTEDTTTAKNCKNICKEIGTRLSAGIQDSHRTRNEREVYVHLWAYVLEETESELEAMEGCLAGLGKAGYTTWIRKNRWLTLPAKIGKCSSSGVLAEVLPSMNPLKKGQNIQIARHPERVKETPAGGSLSGWHHPLCLQWPRQVHGRFWRAQISSWLLLTRSTKHRGSTAGWGHCYPSSSPASMRAAAAVPPPAPGACLRAPHGVHSVSRKWK